mgnify:CR=1 FL=1
MRNQDYTIHSLTIRARMVSMDYKNLDVLSFISSTLCLLEKFEKWEEEFKKVSDDKYTYNEKAKDYLYEILEARNFYNK